ncbi:hypothetical protein ZPAH1_orf00168 [Aeromonas phage ZPAH1]|nr:hypothetical protein ASwh1_118 [Aeromonas phage Aswh_1]QQG33930.1 hypothetical protein ZPAH1_orf00168 [Aeromonas phage ZPAH1]
MYVDITKLGYVLVNDDKELKSKINFDVVGYQEPSTYPCYVKICYDTDGESLYGNFEYFYP